MILAVAAMLFFRWPKSILAVTTTAMMHAMAKMTAFDFSRRRRRRRRRNIARWLKSNSLSEKKLESIKCFKKLFFYRLHILILLLALIPNQ